jgi:DNA (cytosine-5)-methyltransferase 1
MPRLLDGFCGAGGCSVGYARAGFEVEGVDIELQPHYPFKFHLGDAIEFILEHGHEYDVIHASPPCQRYSEATPTTHKEQHPDLIGPTRDALLAIGKPYIIENVSGARSLLYRSLMLCGTMFGLTIWRHRYFEIEPIFLLSPATCQHNGRPVVINPGSNARRGRDDIQLRHNVTDWREAMGIDWMTGDELSQAIPPAYTEWIGRQLLEVLNL